MAVAKKFSTIYLQGEGIANNGAEIAQSSKLTKDAVRREIASQIYERLVNAYAMLEVAKEIEVFDDTYAEDIISKAKDTDNQFDTKKDIKEAIYSEISKAMKKANKEFKFAKTKKDSKPAFN